MILHRPFKERSESPRMDTSTEKSLKRSECKIGQRSHQRPLRYLLILAQSAPLQSRKPEPTFLYDGRQHQQALAANAIRHHRHKSSESHFLYDQVGGAPGFFGSWCCNTNPRTDGTDVNVRRSCSWCVWMVSLPPAAKPCSVESGGSTLGGLSVSPLDTTPA